MHYVSPSQQTGFWLIDKKSTQNTFVTKNKKIRLR